MLYHIHRPNVRLERRLPLEYQCADGVLARQHRGHARSDGTAAHVPEGPQYLRYILLVVRVFYLLYILTYIYIHYYCYCTGRKAAREMYGCKSDLGWVAHGFTDSDLDGGILGDTQVLLHKHDTVLNIYVCTIIYVYTYLDMLVVPLCHVWSVASCSGMGYSSISQAGPVLGQVHPRGGIHPHLPRHSVVFSRLHGDLTIPWQSNRCPHRPYH